MLNQLQSFKFGLLVLIFFIISCDKNNNSVKVSEPYSDIEILETNAPLNQEDSIWIFYERVLSSGDVYAYGKITDYHMEINSSYFLFWAMIMANKYDYPRAYTDVYLCLMYSSGCNEEDLNCLDIKTKEMALTYLEQGAKKGESEAIYLLEKLKYK